MEIALSAKEVSYSVRVGLRHRTLIHPLSMTTQHEKVTGLLGENGSGKSTFLKMVMGLIRPTKGELLLGGKPPMHPDARKGVGFVPESPRFPNGFNLIALFQLYMRTGGLRSPSLSETEKALSVVGLEDGKRKLSHQLSRGQRQRFSLALAFYQANKMLVCDEPMTGLDPHGQQAMRTIMRQFAQSSGCSILIATHHLEDIEYLCSSVVGIKAGHSLGQFPASHWLATPRSEIAMLVSSVTRKQDHPQQDAPTPTLRRVLLKDVQTALGLAPTETLRGLHLQHTDLVHSLFGEKPHE